MLGEWDWDHSLKVLVTVFIFLKSKLEINKLVKMWGCVSLLRNESGWEVQEAERGMRDVGSCCYGQRGLDLI